MYAPFFTGRLIHHCLEFKYKFNTPIDVSIDVFMRDYELENRVNETLWLNDQPLIEKEIALARGILNHYELWQQHDQSILADQAFDFIELERSFVAPIRTRSGNASKRFHLAGRFDGVVQHKETKRYYLWEIKTTRSITERIKQLDLEEQADAYTLAAQEILGIELSGIVYTLIRKKLPEVPEQLKNGSLSINKSIDTSPEYLVQTIKAFHPNTDPNTLNDRYGTLIQHLINQPHKFFQRVIIRRSQAELKAANQEIYQVASEMTKVNIPIYKTAGPHCNFCLFRTPCLMLQQGQNPNQFLSNNYQQNMYHLTEEA